MPQPKLYLIPNLLGDASPEASLPNYNTEVVESLNLFVVENEKSARKFIKKICPNKPQSSLEIHILDKHTEGEDLLAIYQLLDRKESIGIISEAGLPAVADPGSLLVQQAHKVNFSVVPLVGPSSILLALMASGMNGQSFAFHGYLPIDKNERKKKLQHLEKESALYGTAQIFMETPYRNQQLINDVTKFLNGNTLFCVACDLTLPSEFISTQQVKNWKNCQEDFHKRPAIFILQAQ